MASRHWVTVAAAARLSGIPERTIRRHAADGTVRSRRPSPRRTEVDLRHLVEVVRPDGYEALVAALRYGR